jgi:hypothetical protein
MTIHSVDKNMYVENVVIDYRDRPEGSESKLNTYSDGFKVLLTIARLFRTYRPVAFFGLLAIFLTILSAAFMIPIIVSFAETGLVEKFPTLIVCGFVFLTAIISMFSGLVLDSIKQKQRQDFERNLIVVNDQFKELKSSN